MARGPQKPDAVGIAPLLVPVAAAAVKALSRKRRPVAPPPPPPPPQPPPAPGLIESLTSFFSFGDVEKPKRSKKPKRSERSEIHSRAERSAVEGPEGVERTQKLLENGVGGLAFRAQAPPGSGRLVRLPFYPASPRDAISATFLNFPVPGVRILVDSGIEDSGDDPIANLVFQEVPALGITVGNLSKQVPLEVPQMEYGTYRILGLQTHEWGIYFIDNPDTTLIPLAPFWNPLLAFPTVTVGNLRLQNGRSLFLAGQNQQMAASTFAILPYDSSNGSGVIFTVAGISSAPAKRSVWERRKSRFFSGLRDNPVVERNTNVAMFAQALLNPIPAIPFPGRLCVPFSANLVAEILEDEVYGNPIVPSASARAGAQTKLSLKPGPPSSDLTPSLLLQSTRYIPPERR